MAKVKYYAKENSSIGTHSFYAVPIPNGTLTFDEFSPVQRCGVTLRQMPDGGTEYHATTNGHEKIERGGTELMHAAAKCYTDFRKEHPEVTEMRFYTDELVEINDEDEEAGE